MGTLSLTAFAFLLAGFQASAPSPTSLPKQNPLQEKPATHVTGAQENKAATEARKAAATEQSGQAPENRTVVLDSVVAIINGDVLLQSDVQEERRFESLQLLPASDNTDQRAAEHLITRTLILQQMKEQDLTPPAITDAALDKSIAELKRQLPGCRGRCGTEAGWAGFLAQRGLTPDAVRARWRQRLLITDFLNTRFRMGQKAPEKDVQAYYDTNLAPQFRAKHETPPSLKSLQPRIEEILLQQQVTKQINDWEATLRQEGSVQILVAAYGESNTEGGEANDVPGGGQ